MSHPTARLQRDIDTHYRERLGMPDANMEYSFLLGQSIPPNEC